FFFQAEDGIRDATVTGVQTCALPISVAVAKSIRIATLGVREFLIRVTRMVQPVTAPALSVVRRSEQPVDYLGERIGRCVVHKCKIGRASCRERGEIMWRDGIVNEYEG